VAHVGIQRLGPGKGQHNGTHGHKQLPALRAQKARPFKGFSAARMAGAAQSPPHRFRQNHKPQHDDRAKQFAHHTGAKALHCKQATSTAAQMGST
jgi:hypothetical protein